MYGRKTEGKKMIPDCLSYEVTDNTTIINVHPGPIRVENSGNPDLCTEELIESKGIML